MRKLTVLLGIMLMLTGVLAWDFGPPISQSGVLEPGVYVPVLYFQANGVTGGELMAEATVILTGTLDDITASQVLIFNDNGDTPGAWDATDTELGGLSAQGGGTYTCAPCFGGVVEENPLLIVVVDMGSIAIAGMTAQASIAQNQITFDGPGGVGPASPGLDNGVSQTTPTNCDTTNGCLDAPIDAANNVWFLDDGTWYCRDIGDNCVSGAYCGGDITSCFDNANGCGAEQCTVCADDFASTAIVTPNFGLSWDTVCTGPLMIEFTASAADDLDAIKFTIPAGWGLPANFVPGGGVGIIDSDVPADITHTDGEVTIDFTDPFPGGAIANIQIAGTDPFLTAPAAEETSDWIIQTKGSDASCTFQAVTVSPSNAVAYQAPESIAVDREWQSVQIIEGGTATTEFGYVWTCTDACGEEDTQSGGVVTGICDVITTIGSPCVSIDYNDATDKIDVDDTGALAVGGVCTLTGSIDAAEATSEIIVYDADQSQGLQQGVDGGTEYTLNTLTITPSAGVGGGVLAITDIEDTNFPGEAACGPWDVYNSNGGTGDIAEKPGCEGCLTGDSYAQVDCAVVPLTGAKFGFGATSGGQVYTAPAFGGFELLMFLALAIIVMVAYLYTNPTNSRRK